MGCISSKSTTSSQHYRHTNRRISDGLTGRNRIPVELNISCHQSLNSSIGGLWPVNSGENLQYGISQQTYPNFSQRVPQPKTPSRPCFGEYRCICGRTWSSRLSWQGNYQLCKRCKRSVHPYKQRELLPSDITTHKEKCEQHPKELCQRCQQLGFYCGKQQIIKPRYQECQRN